MSKKSVHEDDTKRYFIVFYFAIRKRNKQVHGMLRCTTSNQEYLNRNLIVNSIKQQDPKVKNAVLTNIIELSLKEFKEFSA